MLFTVKPSVVFAEDSSDRDLFRFQELSVFPRQLRQLADIKLQYT